MQPALTFILLGTGLFAMIFGIRCLQSRENMAMIQNGMDPKLGRPQAEPYKNLKWGLLLMGAGMGLFIAYLLDHTVLNYDNGFRRASNVAVYFGLIGVFGGLGLLISYLVEKKEVLDKEK